MKTLRNCTQTCILAGTLVLATAACSRNAGGPPPRPPVAIKLAPATLQDTPVLITSYGTLLDRENAEIVPQVSGLLLAVLVQEGASVTNGQPLFQIDPRDYQMRVDQAEGMLAVDRANLELARSTLQRNQPLLEKKLISPDTFDTIKAKVAALESQLAMDVAARDQARLNLSRCTITAPLAGLCSKRYVDAGNLVAAGASRLTTIRATNPLRLECAVSEQYLPGLRTALAAGDIAVTLSPRGDTNRYAGTLSFIDNAVNPLTGTILLRGEVPNDALKLWPNQFVDVAITISRIPGAIMVPESSVLFGKTGPYLYVAGADNKAALRPVKTGVRYQDWLQITEGVAAGENVITSGQLALYPGAVVQDAAAQQH